MTAIAIKSFDGMYPVMNSRLLKDNAAQSAVNTKITGGSLKPYKSSSTIVAKRSGGLPVSIYRFGQSEASDNQYWFEFTADADVIRGPVSGDIYERTYYTVSGQEPRMTTSQLVPGTGVYPNGFYRLGVPPPVNSASAAATGTATDTVAEQRYYVYTFVSTYGEEGPPSQVSSVSVLTGQTVNLTGMSTSPSGNYNINRKRIYRTVSGTNATDFQFVAEIAAATTSYSDTKTSGQLGEVIPSDGWYPPRSSVHNEPGGSAFSVTVVDPSPYTLTGLTLMANGIAAGYAGNIVCFSEPYMPHAWKRENELVSDYQIVATKAFGQSLAVLTAAYPYLIQGSDPSSMTMTRLDDLHACSSKRSAVTMSGGVVYASPDGLVQINNGGVQLLTKGLFTKEEWQQYKPSSIHAYQYDGRYFGFYNNGSTSGCLVFSFNGQEPSLVTLDVTATAGFLEPLTDSLYLLVGTNIVKFDSGSALTYSWKSKKFTLPKPENLGVCQVVAKSYPVSLTINSYDTDTSYTKSVANSNAFRLPAGKRYNTIDVQVSGTAEVEQVLLSSSMDEMKQL
jgi:hypothetical protein